MPILPIETLDDPRVALYRNLKDKQLAREGDRFLAEGEFLVRRLLASRFPCESILVEPHRAEELADLAGPDTPVYVAPPEVINGVIGFDFHRGALAIGKRLPPPDLADVVAPDEQGNSLLLICPKIHNSENLGAMLRTAACMGVTGVLLGPKCSDPFWRRTARVSMGAVFSLPIRRSPDLEADLLNLRDQFGFTLAATVLDEKASPLTDETRPPRFGVLLGSEDVGLAPKWQSLCQRKVTLPMAWEMDSMNVAMATVVFLYHYAHVARPASEAGS